MDPSLLPNARALRDALRRLLVAHGAMNEAHRPCGAPLATPHAWALLALREAGPLTVTSLSDRLNIDRTNVSRLCARMEADNEVTRVAHPEDGRARLVTLTEAGERLAAAVDQSSTAHFAALVPQLDANLSAVISHLDAVARAMSTHHTPEHSP